MPMTDDDSLWTWLWRATIALRLGKLLIDLISIIPGKPQPERARLAERYA